jgi:hypothetical protein
MKTVARITTMAMAFVDAAVADPKHPLVDHIIKAADKEHGRVKERAWNAHLTRKTAQHLFESKVL